MAILATYSEDTQTLEEPWYVAYPQQHWHYQVWQEQLRQSLDERAGLPEQDSAESFLSKSPPSIKLVRHLQV